jgi:predicted metal-dependent enzyme (double-stranded beta helix superfamily)
MDAEERSGALMSPRMALLIEQVRGVVAARENCPTMATRTAEVLHSHLGAKDLLLAPHRVADPRRYRQHILHVERDGRFSIVSLVWLPGQVTPVHDHVSWCVVGVYEGQEHETRYRVAHDQRNLCLVEIGHSVNATGAIAALTPPGDIHLVANRGPGLAISLHVYGANIATLGSSIRRQYDLPVRRPDPADARARQ